MKRSARGAGRAAAPLAAISLAAVVAAGPLSCGPARAACHVSATPVAFGSYDVFSSVPLDSTGTISVSCDEVPPADVTVAIGPSSAGGFLPRRMRSASGGTLDYNLFTSPSMSTVWGDGTAGTSTVLLRNVKRNKPPVVSTIYGRVPARQDVAAGSYSDTLTVTITW